MKKILFILLFSVVVWRPAVVLAQASAEMQTRYQNAQQLLKQQKFDLAMAELLPFTDASQPGPYQPSAMYLYAVAANKAGKNPGATTMLDQLIAGSPTWENIEEAYYLAAKIAFEQKRYDKALKALQNCQSDYIKADAENMKRTFLAGITDKTELKNLQQQFPEDVVLARVYADKLMGGWYADEDRTQFENIIRKFSFDQAIYNIQTLTAGRKKDQYNVAVLLPFAIDNLAQARKNQFLTDLYAGMKLAQDSLSENNVRLNLFAYNSGTDTATTGSVLAMPELKTMDLVIGPVYKSTAKLAAGFATKNKINLVNPLSEDLEIVKNSPNIFLFESSIETRARKAADFAYDSFEPKTAAILFENTKDDTVFARAYRSQFLQRGGQVLLYKKINTKKNPNVMTVYAGIDLNSYGHLVVSSRNLPAAVATISQVESQNIKLPVVTNDSWLEMPQLSLQQLDELEIYFVHPKFMETSTPEVSSFRNKYLSTFNIPPSPTAFSGFELLYFYGNLLNNYGTRFQNFLPNNGAVSGVFFSGINYGQARDNQYVPLVKLENQQLTLVNPIGR